MNMRIACLIADRITDGAPLVTDPETWSDRDGNPLDDNLRQALRASSVDEVRAAFALAAARLAGMELTTRTTARYVQLLEPYLTGGPHATIADVRDRMSPLERAELDDLLALTAGLPHIRPAAYRHDPAGYAGSTTDRKEPTVGKPKRSKTAKESKRKARYAAGLLIGEAFAHDNGSDPDDYRRGFRDGFQIAHGVNPDDGSPLF